MSLRFLLFVISAFLAAVPVAAAERSFSVTDFTRVRVDGPYNVQLTTGVAPFAKANGSPTAINAISIEVEGRTLVVRKSPSSWGGYPGQSPGPVEISVGTHDVSTLWLNGSGKLNVNRVKGQSFDLSLVGSGSVDVRDLAVDRLTAGITGSGSVTLAGTAAGAKTIVRGTGTLNASGLKVKDADIGADGSAVVKLTVSGTAKIDTQGTATVALAGRPACTVHASGSAVVSGCR